MTGIPDTYKDLFQKKAFAHLATVGADGSPQVTPVWVDFDGTHIRFNTAKGRVKDKNLRRNPKAALSIQDPDNPYRYMQVRGRVAEIPERGAGGGGAVPQRCDGDRAQAPAGEGPGAPREPVVEAAHRGGPLPLLRLSGGAPRAQHGPRRAADPWRPIQPRQRRAGLQGVQQQEEVAPPGGVGGIPPPAGRARGRGRGHPVIPYDGVCGLG